MATKTVVIGDKAFSRKLKKISVTVPINTKREMTKIITEMDSDVKKTIQKGGRSGRIYGKRRHQASAPGEAPKTDSGQLVAGFNFDVKVTNKKIIGQLRNISSHAAAVEFKPKADGGRPFMRPLFKKWRKIASKRLGFAVKSSIKKV